MVFSVKCLGKIDHAGHYGHFFRTVLTGKYEDYEFNNVVCYRIALKAPILSKINLITNIVKEPLDHKMFCHFAKKGGQ